MLMMRTLKMFQKVVMMPMNDQGKIMKKETGGQCFVAVVQWMSNE